MQGLTLASRDIAALCDLTRFGVLGATHLGEWHYGSTSGAAARLATLIGAGYVQAVRPLYRGSTVYIATRVGARFADSGLSALRPSPRLIPHQLAVAGVAAFFLRVCPGTEWITERELLGSTHQRQYLRQGDGHPPDGALSLRGARLAIEVELTPKSAARYQHIMRWYAGALHFAGVIWLSPHAALRRRLADAIQKEALEDFVAVLPLPPGVTGGPWG